MRLCGLTNPLPSVNVGYAPAGNLEDRARQFNFKCISENPVIIRRISGRNAKRCTGFASCCQNMFNRRLFVRARQPEASEALHQVVETFERHCFSNVACAARNVEKVLTRGESRAVSIAHQNRSADFALYASVSASIMLASRPLYPTTRRGLRSTASANFARND